MRRQTVVAALLSAQVPYEQQGRLRYARVQDGEASEQSLLPKHGPSKTALHPAVARPGRGEAVAGSRVPFGAPLLHTRHVCLHAPCSQTMGLLAPEHQMQAHLSRHSDGPIASRGPNYRVS